ncbi:hypothetical protein M422DRAFT_49592 [Sphaerobolus stellatus SS14]|uniref:Uncharacterized protein n=1 Tax=Sphaerobolus stellatus (strain SS14) TaxID=990650 RepID=A0A0C9U8T1_SPHS4|nr:hypothetical protein M422DRAFT_49592 [Sphaerobolus stellatus SS14]
MSSARPPIKKRRFTKAELEKRYTMLKSVMRNPWMPPTLDDDDLLPPVPRSTSPAPSVTGRRKLPPDASEPPSSKVARTSLHHSDVHQSAQSQDIRSAPPTRKDEEPVASTSTAPPPTATAAPIPTAPTPGGPESAPFVHRRGKPTSADFSRLYDRYLNQGKQLKYSSETRTQTTAGASKANNSVIARFEMLDGLLNFTYAMWCRDMADGKIHHTMWDTIDQFLKWVRTRWETHDTKGNMLAFIGLIRLLEAHIYARKAWQMNTTNSTRLYEIDKMLKGQAKPDTVSSISPATSLGGSSSHSTASAASPPAHSPMLSANGISRQAAPSHATPIPASAHPTSSAPPTVAIPKDLFEHLNAAHNCMMRSSRAMQHSNVYFNLTNLHKNFPQTFSRISSPQLRYDEEYEVDFDQDDCGRPEEGKLDAHGGEPLPAPGEGQLWLPNGLAASGDGIGWVCLLGRAMLREAAYPLGYRGLDGIIRRDPTASR